MKKLPRPVEPAANSCRAKWAAYFTRLKAFRRGWLSSTIQEIRDAFPRDVSFVRDPGEKVPDLGDVHGAVKAYQRRRDFFTNEYMLRLRS